LSYTRLAHSTDAAALAANPGDALAIDPAEFDVDDSAGEVGPDELPPGASSGLLLHDVLEVADPEAARRAPDLAAWASDPDIAALIADKARARGIAERHLAHAAAIAYRTLTAPLAEAAALAREVEFGYPIPAIPAIPATSANPAFAAIPPIMTPIGPVRGLV